MKSRIRFTEEAYERLDEIAEYIDSQTLSKKTTAGYIRKLRDYITETLSRFPQAGRPAEELAPGVRKLVYQGFSIIYRLGDERIDILTLYRENLP